MTFLLALSSFLSRLLGVYRNHALAALFGASGVSDAYFAAFQVPDTLYRLLVFGAISASFVPLFLSLHKQNPEDAQNFVASVMNGFLLFMLMISVVVFVFAPQFISLMYPALSPEIQMQTTELLRIMLLSPLFFTCSSIFGGVQNAFRTFWGFALAPIVYNAGIIFGILVLAPRMGINGVAYGVVLGAFAHAAVQLVPAIRLGFRWRPVLHWSKAFKTMILTAIPRVLSMAGFQMNFFIEGVIATTLFAGNLTVLRYAQDIQSFPIGIIGVSVAISSFSLLSNMVIDQKMDQLSSYISHKLEHLFFLMIPASFGLFVLKEPVVQLILESGVFSTQATQLTAVTVGYLCIGLIAAAVSPFVNRIFFAFHDTMRPFWVMVITVVGNTVLAYVLAQYIGVSGIGLASSVSSTLGLILLCITLYKSHLRRQAFFPFKNTLMFLLASLVMSVLLSGLAQSFSYSQQWPYLLAQIILMTALGVIIYSAVLFILMRRKLTSMVMSLGK